MKDRFESKADNQKFVGDMLVFRHVPNHEIARAKAEWYRKLLADDTVETFDPDDLESARRMLERITREELEARGADSVSIGVSSGLDSRACLGAVLDVLPRENVFVFTYGHAGNRDYENAPHLLKGSVVNHTLINTKSASMAPTKNNPFKIKRQVERIVFSGIDDHSGKVQVVGRLGDALTGGHLTSKSRVTWVRAKSDFIARFSKRPLFEDGWLPQNYDPLESLPENPFLPAGLVEYDLQLDLLYRQQQLICLKPGLVDPINRPLLDATDAQIEDARRTMFCPFMDPRWQKSFLKLPRSSRLKQKFYKSFLLTSYPDIFPELDGRYEMISPKGSTNVDWGHLWKSSETFRDDMKLLVEKANAIGHNFDFDSISNSMESGDRFAQNLLQRISKIVQSRAISAD